MTLLDVLDREMYTESEAARLLRVPQGTLHYWLEGGTQRSKSHRPVLRLEPTGRRVVTWAEFVEAALLRNYRKRQVPMAELRVLIDYLRRELGVPYPLAHHRPYVSGKNLVLEAQIKAGLSGDFCLVAVANNQLILTSAAREFVDRVEWDGDTAAGWRPHDDPHSPVRVLPDVRFGRPSVSGISTDVIWEHDQSGEDVEEIANAFDISAEDVRWALAYENSVGTKSA